MTDSKPSEGPSPDDNLVTKREHVKQSIETIRQRKQRILAALQGISGGEEPADKAAMAQLVSAFDALTEQEKQYMGVLQAILMIHEKAASDVAVEIKEGRERLAEAVAAGGKEKAEEQPEKGETEADQDEVSQLMREISEVSAKAIAASMLNDQLVNRLHLHKSKHITMKQQRDDRSSAQLEVASEAISDFEKIKLQVSEERSLTEKKKRELDRLRKAALQKNCEDNTHAALPEVVESERIPFVVKAEEEEKSEDAEKKEMNEEERRRLIKERVKAERERRENVNAAIREKLAAMNARKQRMAAIRAILTGQRDAGEDEKEKEKDEEKEVEVKQKENEADEETRAAEKTGRDIQDTLAEATNSLRQLTAFRERLEHLQAAGEAPSQEDHRLIQALLHSEGAESAEHQEE